MLTWNSWPLESPYRFTITGPFGAMYSPWSSSHPHMGLDIGTNWSTGDAIAGEPVYAPCPGPVVVHTNDGSFGISVCIQNEKFVLFAHLLERVVSEGDAVEAGDLIGYVGKTGTDAEHLHWQVCDNSQFPRDLTCNYDPLSFPFEEDDMTPDQETALAAASSADYQLQQQVFGQPGAVSAYVVDASGNLVTLQAIYDALVKAKIKVQGTVKAPVEGPA